MSDTEMTLKLIEKSTETVKKEPQLVMEIITPDIIDYLWHDMQPYVEAECKNNGEYAPVDVYSKIKWGGTNLYFFYIVSDLDSYYKGMDKKSPAGKYQRLFDGNTKKDFAGYVLVDFNLQDKKPPAIWQAVVAPKYENHNVYELGFKYLEKEFKELGMKYITMSGLRKDVHDKAMAMGFKEMHTVYKLNLVG